MATDRQGWFEDPFGQHDARYFSAGRATALVRDGEVESEDPLPEHAAHEHYVVESLAPSSGRTLTMPATATTATITQHSGLDSLLADVAVLPVAVRGLILVRGVLALRLIDVDLVSVPGGFLALALVGTGLYVIVYTVLTWRVVYRPTRALRLVFQAVNASDVALWTTAVLALGHPGAFALLGVVPVLAALVSIVLLNLPDSRRYFTMPVARWRGAYLLASLAFVAVAVLIASFFVGRQPSVTGNRFHRIGTLAGTSYSVNLLGDTRLSVRTTGAITTSCSTSLPYDAEGDFGGDGEDVCPFGHAPVAVFIVTTAVRTARVELENGTTGRPLGSIDISAYLPGRQLLVVDTAGRTITGVTFPG